MKCHTKCLSCGRTFVSRQTCTNVLLFCQPVDNCFPYSFCFSFIFFFTFFNKFCICLFINPNLQIDVFRVINFGASCSRTNSYTSSIYWVPQNNYNIRVPISQAIFYLIDTFAYKNASFLSLIK